MPGYLGRLLEVDLTTGDISITELDDSLYTEFLGGYGLGARLLYTRQLPGVAPLGPENHLLLAGGPLVGTCAPMASRYTIMSKSPLTGTWGDANSGGAFGPMLKFAGFDAILVTGIAQRPCYLWIHDGQAELRDASHLWGNGTRQTLHTLQQETHPEAEVTSIGPAGETESLIACIIGTGGRAAGRSGLGAVMGSKRLKSIVVYGNAPVPTAHPQRLWQLRQDASQQLSGPLAENLREFGTCAITEEAIRYGSVAVKNWKGIPKVDFPYSEKLGGEAMQRLEIAKNGCYGCPIQCGGTVKVGQTKTRKPEHQTLSAFGPLCLNDDLEAIIRANALCDDYGLDTISTAATIAFAMECHENGVFSATEVGDLNLDWGNADTIVQLTEQIARRQGLGEVLADGVQLAAQRLGRGTQEFAIHIHGQEPAMYDPKFSPGYATSYKMDATPGRHTQGGAANVEGYAPEGMDIPEIHRHEYSGKGEVHRQMSNLVHVVNAAGLCLFGIVCLPMGAIPAFLNAAMGTAYTMDDLYHVGERIANIRHAFNLREGINSVDFKLPRRLLKGVSNQGKGWAEVDVNLEVQVEEYLHAMDWEPQTGKPSRRKLEQLGLHDVAQDLWR